MKNGLKSVLWSAAALVLLLAISVPLLNALVVSVMMIPTVILYATLPKRLFALHMVVILGLAFAVIGPAALIIGLFFLVPSIVMGHMYRKQLPARKVITVTLLVLLAEFLLELVIFSALLDISLLEEMGDLIRGMTDNLDAQGLLPAGWSAEATDLFIQTLIHSIPMALITVSFMYAVITHAVVRPVLRASGLQVPGLQPAKDWMLPRIFVLYYLIILIMDLSVSNSGSSFLTVALLNLVPLMRLAFSIQAIGFFFFIADQRKWNKVVPILLSVLVIVFPPLSLIGVLDAGFPIRRAFKKP